MKLHDYSQNLPVRVGVIHVAAFVLLAILGARLYYLQIVKGDYYSERAENQRMQIYPDSRAARSDFRPQRENSG